jgi:hypothetical protein
MLRCQALRTAPAAPPIFIERERERERQASYERDRFARERRQHVRRSGPNGKRSGGASSPGVWSENGARAASAWCANGPRGTTSPREPASLWRPRAELFLETLVRRGFGPPRRRRLCTLRLTTCVAPLEAPARQRRRQRGAADAGSGFSGNDANRVPRPLAGGPGRRRIAPQTGAP